MRRASRILTLDANVLIAALKGDEFHNRECAEIVGRVPDPFLLSEPSVIYQEVCGTLARRVGRAVADKAKEQLDHAVHPKLLVNCSRSFCVSAYPLCSEYEIYAMEALYLRVALDKNAVLVSLDKEDFIDKVKSKRLGVEAYYVPDFPY